MLLSILLVCAVLSVDQVGADVSGSCCNARCFCDTQGPDDSISGVLNLNKYCRHLNEQSTSDCPSDREYQEYALNFDRVDLRGSARQIACALFDDNNNNLVDVALCMVLQGSGLNVTARTTSLYSCTDGAADRCTGATLLGCNKELGNLDPTPSSVACASAGTTVHSSTTTSIQTGPEGGDPYSCFGGHSSTDLEATGCTLASVEGADRVVSLCAAEDDLGSTNAEIVDVCSYTFLDPSTPPVDCVTFAPCSALECHSLGCASQECNATLGRCLLGSSSGDDACDDGFPCTEEKCCASCDETGCVALRSDVCDSSMDVNSMCVSSGTVGAACPNGDSDCGCDCTVCTEGTCQPDTGDTCTVPPELVMDARYPTLQPPLTQNQQLLVKEGCKLPPIELYVPAPPTLAPTPQPTAAPTARPENSTEPVPFDDLPPTCVSGSLGCTCNAESPRCDVGGSCNGDICTVRSCVPGSPGCLCNQWGKCDNGAKCFDGVCEESALCRVGEQGCRCTAGGACGENLECDDNLGRCVPPTSVLATGFFAARNNGTSCPTGSLYCACSTGFVCDPGLRCQVTSEDDVEDGVVPVCEYDVTKQFGLSPCPIGSIGCACATGSLCDARLTCTSSKCMSDQTLVTDHHDADVATVGEECTPGGMCAGDLFCSPLTRKCTEPCIAGRTDCPCRIATYVHTECDDENVTGASRSHCVRNYVRPENASFVPSDDQLQQAETFDEILRNDLGGPVLFPWSSVCTTKGAPPPLQVTDGEDEGGICGTGCLIAIIGGSILCCCCLAFVAFVKFGKSDNQDKEMGYL